jgi:hypothetical protein
MKTQPDNPRESRGGLHHIRELEHLEEGRKRVSHAPLILQGKPMRKEMLPEHMTSGIKLKTASKAFLPEYTLSASILLVMRRPRIISTAGLLF